MKRLMSLSLVLGISLIGTFGCETTGSKKKANGGKSFRNFAGGKSKSGGSQDDSAYISAKRTTLIQSLSNNGATPYTVSTSKASSQANRIPSGSKDKTTLEGKLAAQRLAKVSFSSAMATAKSIARIEMQKGANRHINDAVKLDLALAAINSRKYSMAYYYLNELKTSKVAKLKAAAHNIYGVIAMEEDRIPEAVDSFKKALQIMGSYEPAKLNLALAALKGGDAKTAQRALGGVDSNWFVDYANISIARLNGDRGRVDSLCDKVLSKQGNHKAALFNCGLHNLQSKKDYGKAKNLMNKAANSRGGEAGWNNKISDGLKEASAKARAAQANKPAPKKDAKGKGK